MIAYDNITLFPIILIILLTFMKYIQNILQKYFYGFKVKWLPLFN